MPMPVMFQNETDPEAAVIGAGESLSGAVRLPVGHTLVAIQMPAVWTAADLTFQAGYDGITYGDVYDEAGSEVVVKAAAGRVVTLTPADWCGLGFLKVRSGTAASAQVQATARTLVLITRPL